MRNHPRTGIVGIGRLGKKRNQPVPITPETKEDNHPIKHGKAPVLDMDIVLAAAREIGKEIAEQLAAKLEKQQTKVVHVTSVSGSSPRAEDHGFADVVEIDESIADVGIGDDDGMKKGSNAGELAAAETKTDASLKKTRSKLQQLKRGK